MILDRFSLGGKSGILTGGGTGPGKAMANAVVQAGVEILIVGSRRKALHEAAREMNRVGDVSPNFVSPLVLLSFPVGGRAKGGGDNNGSEGKEF